MLTCSILRGLSVPAVLFVMVSSCATRAPEANVTSQNSAVIKLDYKETDRFTVTTYSNHLVTVRRNADGTALYLQMRGAVAVIRVGHAPALVPLPRNYGFINERLEVAASYDDVSKAVYLADGFMIPMSINQRFVMDPSASLFAISETGTGTRVFGTAEPKKELLVTAPDFFASHIFAREGRIWLVGLRRKSYRDESLRCLVYQSVSNRFVLAREIALPGGGLEDMDPEGNTFLVNSGPKKMPVMWLYRADTEDKQLMGAAPEYAFFADPRLGESIRKSQPTL